MNWKTSHGKLERTFKFNDFLEVIEFINLITPICENAGHHPDFKVFDYKFIKFELVTHDKNMITDKDYNLAKEIDVVFDKM